MAIQSPLKEKPFYQKMCSFLIADLVVHDRSGLSTMIAEACHTSYTSEGWYSGHFQGKKKSF